MTYRSASIHPLPMDR